MPRTPSAIVHRTTARLLLEHLRALGAEPGARLTEESLAAAIGTSRAPVRGALAILAEAGVVLRAGRRLELRRLPDDINQAVPLEAGGQEAEALYAALVRDRLRRALPETIGSAELMRRYEAGRILVSRVMQQVLAEGWAEKAPAGSWRFLALIDSPEGQEEAYRFRRALEPAALLDPGFDLPRSVAERLRREQAALAGGGAESMTARQVFEAHSGFHLALMQASNNRFFADAALRVTRLRRLVGYVIAADRDRLVQQSTEHLAILDRIEQGDRDGAATLMVRHLDAGRQSKARLLRDARFRPGPEG
ncbi:FCD domain-containing protein [Roseomonas sp. 18066]|uniref:FCD domain-containing protein n=1 Tax=Roseomonas sp. 18066 TaxID=2681412 RepID=UPI001358D68B|nr:FCD domain-containing protein [Roseomonas sp. 18066]